MTHQLATFIKNPLATLQSPREVVQCRYCGSTDVRPSQKVSLGSRHVTYRCRACKHHFKVETSQPNYRLLAGALVALLVILGLVASLTLNSAPEVEYTPRVDTGDAQAFAATKASAARGDPQAQFNLGWTHWMRDEFPQALPWLKKAAAQDHPEAIYLLGQAYLYGRGTVQNYRTALDYFSQAAEQGHLESQYQVGIFHRDGLASPPNREQAYVWLNLAAAQGHTDAGLMRDKLTTAMTGEETLRAQEASAEIEQRLASQAVYGQPQTSVAATAH